IEEARLEHRPAGGGGPRQPCRETEERERDDPEQQRDLRTEPAGRDERQRAPGVGVDHRSHARDAAAERMPDEVWALETEGAPDAVDDGRIERIARIEVPRAAHGCALTEAGEVERDRAPARRRDALD